MVEPLKVLEPYYFAPISFYLNLLSDENVILSTSSNYTKKTLKNRTYILGANGTLRLSIPLLHQGNERKKYNEIKISYAEKWQKDHWNSIISAYRRSPFFEFYEDELAQFYNQQYEYLSEYNLELNQWILKKIQLNQTINVDDSKTELSQMKHFDIKPYLQVFSDRFEFQSNLSILDVLFNMGGSATKSYLLSHF